MSQRWTTDPSLPPLLARLGLEPAQVTAVTPVHRADAHRVERIACGGRSFVLRRFAGQGCATEVRAYALLRSLGVPTLQVHAMTPGALLLEDLADSPRWRRAVETDLSRAEVGAAVARWYRALHAAGDAAGGAPVAAGRLPACFTWETDVLDPATVLRLGEWLGLSADPVWGIAAAHLDAQKHALRCRAATLTYNDFHWTNLALSRAGRQREAVVYDYHLLGIGPAYSDVRNVLSVLHGDAALTFTRTYGSTDATEAVLDAPLATLCGLALALRRPRFPAWGIPLRRSVESGEFAASLERALAAVDSGA